FYELLDSRHTDHTKSHMVLVTDRLNNNSPFNTASSIVAYSLGSDVHLSHPAQKGSFSALISAAKPYSKSRRIPLKSRFTSACLRLCVFALGVFTRIPLLGICMSAQRTTGTLRGQVLDPQSAAVANATVTVVNEQTGVTQSVTTSSAGTWSLPAILPG